MVEGQRSSVPPGKLELLVNFLQDHRRELKNNYDLLNHVSLVSRPSMTDRLILDDIQLVGNFVPGLEYPAQYAYVGCQIGGRYVKT